MVDFRRNSPLQAFLAGEQAADASAARDINLERSRLALGTEQQQAGQSQEMRKIQFMNRAASALLQLPDEQFQAAFQRLAPAAQQVGIDPTQFSPDQLTRQNLESLKTQTQEFLRDPNALAQRLTGAERERNALLKELEGATTAEGQLIPVDQLTAGQRAAAIKLRLIPGAQGSSAITTATTPGLTEQVAGSESQIKGDVKTSETRGKEEEQRAQGIINRGVTAAESTATVRRALTLLDQVKTGGVAAASLSAKQLFGVEGADEGELSNSLGKAVLSQLRETFGAAFTQEEGQRLERIEAGFGKSPATNRRLLGQALRVAERTSRRALALAEARGDTETVQDIQELLEFTLDEPQAQPDLLQEARDAIARGADRNAVLQRLQERGISPEGL